MAFPAGTYRAKARKAELGETKNGNVQIGIEFEVIEGEEKGSRLTYYGGFSEEGADWTVKVMRVAGFLGDDFTDLSSLSRADAPTVELVVKHEEYEGKTRAKVKFVNPAGGLSMKKPLDGAGKAALNARMRSVLAAVDQDLRGSGSSAAPAAPPKAPDGLPF